MAKPEFSETQYVLGFLSEVITDQFNSPVIYPPFFSFFMPSTIIEPELGVDFVADYYTHSEYFQFKRSEFFGGKRGGPELKANLPISFKPYYRFTIYNDTSKGRPGQFETLKNLASSFPKDLVCYCAPCFHLEVEFHHLFRARALGQQSIIVQCGQFNGSSFNPPQFDINDGYKHTFCFKMALNYGYLCSEAIRVDTTTYDRVKYRDKDKSRDFISDIGMLYEKFYLANVAEYEIEEAIETTSPYLQFQIVRRYLMQYYDIVWQPRFYLPNDELLLIAKLNKHIRS